VQFLVAIQEHPVEIGTQVMDETILIAVGVTLIPIIILGKHLEQVLVHCCLDAK